MNEITGSSEEDSDEDKDDEMKSMAVIKPQGRK